ncbi:MAG TPA: indolepyruvate oxidoreductase subunit beta family protein [Vineibacter sp.]|nr:indolepyruvate oxidoreductase subunit beta family protein [Vineibacter sp.]
MTASDRPVTILIAALGGDGGGVLCDWIVEAAHAAGLPAQATQIPGVAQRTGATTYYLEVLPTPRIRLGDRAPVLALNPAMGEVDVLLASELLEAGRMIANGWVTPDRTTLIASSHRVFAIGERVAMADGRFDVGRLLRAVKERSKAQVLFDMDQAAEESGSVLNAVLLGALAGAGTVPIPDTAFESAIRAAGKSVDANLAGFAFGRAHARGELEQTVRAHHKRQAQARGIEDLVARARQAFPVAAHDIVEEGVRRLTDYQDRTYAARYLDRLDNVWSVDKAAGGDGMLLRETARHLAVRMSFEDVIRVAQVKVSGERFAQVRQEVRAKAHEPVAITEHFKPGIEEICGLLPPGLARRIMAWAERTGRLGKWYWSMHVRSSTVSGFLRLWLLSKLRWWRPRSWRYAEEQAQIGHWLEAIRRAAPLSQALAREIAECARLVKGYGDTHKRGLRNWTRIEAALIAPALSGTMAQAFAADAIASARVAALADPEGDSLDKTLADIASRTPELRRAAE